MATHYFQMTARDLLFMRDARPMEGSDAGKGNNWPRPDQIYYSLLHAFHRMWPELQPWEHTPETKNRRKNGHSSDRFGGLKTIGPFPLEQKSGQLFLPCPLDVTSDDNGYLYPMGVHVSNGTNLPAPLTHAFSSKKLGKHPIPQWITIGDYQKYLAGDIFKPEGKDLYETERNIGIEIDPASHSTVEKKLYQAEYLRLRPNTSLAIAASCEVVTPANPGNNCIDIFEQFAHDHNITWDENESIPLIMGGQQGVVNLAKQMWRLPDSQLGTGRYLRWTLLSPAVFPALQENTSEQVSAHPGGWLPTWVDPSSGNVMLPRHSVARHAGESRRRWRDRITSTPKCNAKLVAARIGNPLAFSGWDLRTGPKPTSLAVPAGSTYIFECVDDKELADLAAMLSWNGSSGDEIVNRRSGAMGEKGYGIGICSTVSLDA